MKLIICLLFFLSTTLTQTTSQTVSQTTSKTTFQTTPDGSKKCSNSLECWIPLTFRNFCCLGSKCQITNSACPDNDFVQENFKKCNETVGCFGKCGFAIRNCCCIDGTCSLAKNGTCPLG